MKLLKPIYVEISFLVVMLIWVLNTGDFGTSSATSYDNKTSTTVKIDDVNITALVAITPEEQSTGLAIKDIMNENEGMLFVFDTPKKYSFWMKDMKFPIDIIWLDSNRTIVHIEHSLEPCLFLLPCPSYSPASDSLYVLEVVSNFTNKHDIKIGNQVLFNMSRK